MRYIEAQSPPMSMPVYSSLESNLASYSTALSSTHIKELLAAIESDDVSKISAAAMQLSSELSMLQDSSIPSFVLDQLVSPLLRCVSMNHSPDVVCSFSL